MSVVDHTRLRVLAVLADTERVKEAEYPYPQSLDCLKRVEAVFRLQLGALNSMAAKERKASKLPYQALETCADAVQQIRAYLPIVGFVLGSTDVRNAFEAYRPLLAIARCVLGQRTKLVLSSQWEYSPFTYPRSVMPARGLRDFVLIGLPSPEAGNGMLIPLAGHELGHSVWLSMTGGAYFHTPIVEAVVDLVRKKWASCKAIFPSARKAHVVRELLAYTPWAAVADRASFQAEEVFSDAVGIAVFGEAYLYAFQYFAAPFMVAERPPTYPAMTQRVSYMARAAERLGARLPADFVRSFRDEPRFREWAPESRFLLKLADLTLQRVGDDVLKLVVSLAEQWALPDAKAEELELIRHDFEKLVPAPGSFSLQALLVAAWGCARDNAFWKGIKQIRPKDRFRTINELLLKSVDVLEYTKIVEHAPHH